MSDRLIRIRAGEVSATAALNDSTTADAIWNALPITGQAQTWGDEICFSIPVDAPEAPDVAETVDKGLWPTGRRAARSACSGDRRR